LEPKLFLASMIYSPPIGDRDSLAPTRFGDGDNRTGELFSYVELEAGVRRNHPLRAIRTIVNEALSALEREFAGLYSPVDPAGEAGAGDAVAGVFFASRRHSAGSRPSQGKTRPASAAVIQLTSELYT
jgi:transposase